MLVQCAARPDIIGDVGYSDYRLISAGVVAALIGGGPDGIVEIARVHWINGHNRQVTQVFPFIWMQRSEEHTSELQSLLRISYTVICLQKKNIELSILDLNIYRRYTNYTIRIILI